MKKCLFYSLIFLFILSTSCQKKQVAKTASSAPFPEKPIEKQVEIRPKNIEFKQGISKNIEWINPKPFRIKRNVIPLKHEGIDGGNFIFSLGSYPSFNGLPDKDVEKRVNQIIKGYIDNEIENFWKENFNGKVVEISGRNIYEEWYQILFIDSTICSILFHRYGYRWTESKVMNINLIQGKLIDSNEWFKPGYDYQTVMKEYCKKDLVEQHEKKNGYKDKVKIDMKYDMEFNITAKGFFIFFDLAFDVADGEWSVFVLFSVFGDNCLLKITKSLYGFYDGPEGWNYQDKHFLIKYPPVFDNNGNESNVTSTKIDDVYSLVITLPISRCSQANIKISSQTYYDSKIKPKPIDTNNNETMMIDDALFETNKVFTDQKNTPTNKTIREEIYIFRSIRDKLNLMEYTITISIESLPFETEKEWQENAYQTYYQINQVLSTFEFLS